MSKFPLFLCLLFVITYSTILAQPYQEPEPILSRIVDQPTLPSAGLAPDHRFLALFRKPANLTLSQLSEPELKLAGVRFHPRRYAPSPQGGFDQLSLKNLQTGQSWVVEGLPAEGKIIDYSWSPNSESLGLVVEEKDGLKLWLLEGEKTKVRRLSPSALNGVLIDKLCQWSPDSRSILTALLVPGEAPPENPVPASPVIQETSGKKAPVRTYQDLLKDEADAELFAHYAKSQMARVSLEGTVEKLGDSTEILNFSPSPDGRYILRQTISKPYSLIVPVSRFAGDYSLLEASGKHVKTLASFPAAEELPKGFDAVREGRRSMAWRADKPATLVWVEALDGGDMAKNVDAHDRVFTWAAPFEAAPRALADLEMRYSGITWGKEDLALLSEWRFSDRMTRTWKISPDAPQPDKVLFEERSYNDRYRDPGTPLLTENTYGKRVLATHQGNILLSGPGASPQGNIPFLDRWNWRTGKTERIWQSPPSHYERVLALLDSHGESLLTLRESPEEPPNFYARTLKEEKLEALTALPHPSPEFQGIKKELLRYKRADGVELSGTLYLPADYQGGRLPVLMWAYPREFKDASVAGQITDSPQQFKKVSHWGPLPFVALGYAVFDGPTMPIVGEGEELPNDKFREQLVASAKAAIDVLVEKGVCDRERVAIGGHSYGAFMVANLLAHSDLFKTGIARSGAYNRSLTPFGFQGEERDFWEAQEVYASMSPFFHAEKINEPLLLIHGSDDNNSGTFPMQSERLFAAIKGLGGQARLVMLPKESHGYRARESLLHMLWEEQEWLKKHL